MKTDSHVLNKIITSQTPQYIKGIIFHNQVEFIPNQCNLMYSNKKKHMIIPFDEEK